jgi:hypothetical protein
VTVSKVFKVLSKQEPQELQEQQEPQEPKLFWLASYPKSGNTWTRAFIANLLNEEPDPVDINEFNTGHIASNRFWVEAAFDFDINELSQDEIDRLRPLAYQWASDEATEYGYHKTHDAYSYVDPERQIAMFPPSATAGALVIVRNPLDVLVSYAHHNNATIEKTLEHLNSSEHAMCGKPGRPYRQLRQWLWSWSEFNRSWMQAPVTKKIVRYEDMKANPVQTFTEIATFLKLPNDHERVSDAVDRCRIENLQAQEQQTPFKEKSIVAKSFFRKGVVGDWKDKLTADQVRAILDHHHDLMLELGYIDENGEPL